VPSPLLIGMASTRFAKPSLGDSKKLTGVAVLSSSGSPLPFASGTIPSVDTSATMTLSELVPWARALLKYGPRLPPVVTRTVTSIVAF